MTAAKLFVAAPRDASCYNRPDVRSPKVFHVADAGEWFSTGQPLAGHRDAIVLTALCSGALLDETLMYRSLAEVPEDARCRRRACANHWPAPQGQLRNSTAGATMASPPDQQ